jgi:hypothetical protein
VSWKLVRVEWQDAAHFDDDHDDEGLPDPMTVITVGWLAKDEQDYVVVGRDLHPQDDSYRWRATMAIPRGCITAITELSEP